MDAAGTRSEAIGICIAVITTTIACTAGPSGDGANTAASACICTGSALCTGTTRVTGVVCVRTGICGAATTITSDLAGSGDATVELAVICTACAS